MKTIMFTVAIVMLISGDVLADSRALVKTVSLVSLNEHSQSITLREADRDCVYHVNVKQEKNELLGIALPNPSFNMNVDRVTCGRLVKRVNLKIMPDKKIKGLPVPAGSVFYVFPENESKPKG